MIALAEHFTSQWGSFQIWKRASYNTIWCLIGCSIGDFGTIYYFQATGIAWPTLAIMTLAIINGIITSIALETAIMARQMPFLPALKTACGMSLISMVSMEVAMNSVDVILTGGAILNLWVLPVMLLAGFLVPLPYNYWRLKVHGQACH